jgi:hypothetical protein
MPSTRRPAGLYWLRKAVRGHVAIYPHVATTISLANLTAGQKAGVARNLDSMLNT